MLGKKPLLYILILFSVLIGTLVDLGESVDANETGAGSLVYVIPIEKEVERGLEAFLSRATEEATDEGADHIVFEINTPGGRVDSAEEIAGILQNLEVETTSFIVNQALSAGSYIALNTDNIYMVPTATMGSSGIITQDGNAADQKAQSAWLASMRSAAESKDRDPLYAAAMADPSIDLPEYGASEGQYLTLDANSAIEVEYAQGIVENRVELLHELGLSDATVVETETTLAEEVARFLTNPVVIPILLSVASIGLILELFSPGFGIPGIMGIVSLLLFFYGHIIAGLAGMEAIVLLVIGMVLIIAEFYVSGGIVGALGIGAVIGSLFMSGYDLGHMSISIGIAFLVAVILAVILIRRIGMDKGVFRKVILKDQVTTDQGYVSSENRLELIGLEGIAVTPLRPSGSGVFEEERLDVISEGGFIDENMRIKIVKVEGVRIVVREI
ncbi:membrane-bound serine protease (ClpP class) [Virgibacillus natechei]|uniref:Membrane-bound serine protease (ClpP class) n=1 Tax=Virgibacillus natechei TaxID=1216297 RepID=A0ABS4ICX1_9BACI|nr:nodulation protein NfeD [Virgibacillus natechei]MBP1968708.1 membrane-bound serine protease (ClpP class) [Virgibacillus natechei]UZD11510.1 nodulation protein NfeD [Virgibacillus natechei]